MDQTSLQAWNEAACKAASEADEALRSMSSADLFPLHQVDKEEANGSNSLDQEFMNAIIRGDHLSSDFLRHAF